MIKARHKTWRKVIPGKCEPVLLGHLVPDSLVCPQHLPSSPSDWRLRRRGNCTLTSQAAGWAPLGSVNPKVRKQRDGRLFLLPAISSTALFSPSHFRSSAILSWAPSSFVGARIQVLLTQTACGQESRKSSLLGDTMTSCAPGCLLPFWLSLSASFWATPFSTFL